jgi:hypothetical protein
VFAVEQVCPRDEASVQLPPSHRLKLMPPRLAKSTIFPVSGNLCGDSRGATESMRPWPPIRPGSLRSTCSRMPPLPILRYTRCLLPAWRSNLVRKNEKRRHPRSPGHGVMRILWEDTAGRERVSDGEILDISPAGIKLRVRESIPVRSYMTFNEATLGIRGRGSVRYCNSVGRGYEIGLEFSSGIKGI